MNEANIPETYNNVLTSNPSLATWLNSVPNVRFPAPSPEKNSPVIAATCAVAATY